MYKANFKTARSQREIVIDAKVSTNVSVGTLVKVTFGEPNEITAATTPSDATHLVAQSDMTMEYGHIPVENRNYAYSNVVASSTTPKKVALFDVSDKTDLIVYEV